MGAAHGPEFLVRAGRRGDGRQPRRPPAVRPQILSGRAFPLPARDLAPAALPPRAAPRPAEDGVRRPLVSRASAAERNETRDLTQESSINIGAAFRPQFSPGSRLCAPAAPSLGRDTSGALT